MQIQAVSFVQNTFNKSYKYSDLKKYYNQKISFNGDTFDYEQRKKAKLAQRPWYKRWTGTGKKKVLEDLNNELIGFNLAHDALIEQKNALIKAKEEAQKAAEERAVLLEKELKMERANNNNTKKIAELNKELTAVKKQYTELQTSCDTDKARYAKTVKEQKALAKRTAGKGWERYRGRENLKQQLQEAFINKLAVEKNYGESQGIPNGILIYGQHGTGKTYFVPALAEQANCHLVDDIDMSDEPDAILFNIQKELINAQKRYKNTQQRTIILLDDFNTIAKISDDEKADKIDFDDTTVGRLAKYLDNCAQKYHATIVMTTNYPAKVDSEILSQARVPYKIFLGPPNPQDSALIFKHYLANENIDEDTIDYNELAEKTAKAIEDDQAYSTQGLVNIVNECKRLANETNSKITQADIMKTIEKVGPDISKEQYERYLDDMQYLYNTKEQ